MARIENYGNDTLVTLDDKVIGTDAVDNSTKNFTVGDIVALASAGTTYTAGAGISIANGVISSTIVDTDTNNYISNVALNGTSLDFTGTAPAFSGSIPLAGLANSYTLYSAATATGEGFALTDVTDPNNPVTVRTAMFEPGTGIAITQSVGPNSSLVYEISATGGSTYTWDLDANSGSISPVASGSTVSIIGNNGVSTAISGNTLTIAGATEKLVQSLGADQGPLGAGANQDINFRPVVMGSKDITANSVWYNPTKLATSGYIVQISASLPSTLYARLAISALIDAGSNNQNMTFSLVKQTAGVTTVFKEIEFESNKTGIHPFSFFSYLPLEPGSNYWIAISSTSGGVTLKKDAQAEWVIQE